MVQEPLDRDWQIPEDKSKFHVFVLYGQSNVAGGNKKHQPGNRAGNKRERDYTD